MSLPFYKHAASLTDAEFYCQDEASNTLSEKIMHHFDVADSNAAFKNSTLNEEDE